MKDASNLATAHHAAGDTGAVPRAQPPPEEVTFSFGKNWRDFVGTISNDSVRRAMTDIEEWLGRDRVASKTVIDVGCGSGIHSLCFNQLGAEQLVSFDADKYSVEATELLWQQSKKPANWKVLSGSVLDK